MPVGPPTHYSAPVGGLADPPNTTDPAHVTTHTDPSLFPGVAVGVGGPVDSSTARLVSHGDVALPTSGFDAALTDAELMDCELGKSPLWPAIPSFQVSPLSCDPFFSSLPSGLRSLLPAIPSFFS